MERTFIAIKPDGVKRGLIGEIVSRFEKKGFKIVGMKLLTPTQEMAAKHYAEHVEKPFYSRLVKYITSGPILAMVVEGIDVIKQSRKMMGKTNPQDAEVGTIRFDYAQNMEVNVIHGSDCPESAEREIAIYFTKGEIFDNWKTPLQEIIDVQ
ncbi:MAG: nucleoside-diphosphate kinase [Candidatus Gastranaerophilales bacterium]|nr:nucleoside-diphosphate kinase [Candidatus Gastranaerophilales bacterium]